MTPGQIASYKAACAQYSPAGEYVSTVPDYTADQLDGSACADCGEWFQIGEATVPTLIFIKGSQLFRHRRCPKDGGLTVTGLTMPACAVPLAGTHVYPIAPNRGRERTPAMAAALGVTQTPVLPVGFHWANGPEVHGPRLDLDAPTVALLLFAADLDPMAVGDHAIVAACHEQLLAGYGTTTHAQRVYERDIVADREVAEARMRACTARARQLLNTEA